jgi:hypothetical protein
MAKITDYEALESAADADVMLIVDVSDTSQSQAGTTKKVLVSGLLSASGVQLGADLGGTDEAPEVISTHLTAPLPLAQGGTAAATGPAALTSLGAASASALSAETTRAETAEALKAPLASPVFTGTPAAPTASAGTDTTQLATTAFVTSAVSAETSRAETAEALKAPLASPALSGTPTAPTAAAGTDTTQLATTAFVSAAALPLPSGTPSDGQVPAVSAVSPLAMEWADNGSGGGGSGTVTDVAVESANGFAGTVADSTTTPQLTLSTTVTGVLKGNGTAVSAATAGTDYSTPAEVSSAVSGLAPLASPVFTGTPAAPTAAAGTNTVQLATTAFAAAAAASAQSAAEAYAEGLQPTSGAPLALADGGTGVSAGSDSALLTSLGAASSTALSAETSRAEAAEVLLAPLASPALTGTPAAPTASAGTNTTQLATTAFVTSAVGTETSRAETAEALKAPLASPVLTGTPAAPTATAGTNTTQVATTAFVTTAVSAEASRAETAEALAFPKTGGALTGHVSPAVVTLTDGSSVALNAASGNVFEWVLGANGHTLAAPSNPVAGQVIIIDIVPSGAFTPAFNAVFAFGTDGQPSWSAASGTLDEIAFRYSSLASAWICQGWKLGFTGA